MKKFKKLVDIENNPHQGKKWRPQLVGKAEQKAFEAHDKMISRQLMNLFHQQVRDGEEVYVVRIPLGVGGGDPAKLSRDHITRVANWVRRRGSKLRKGRVAFGAGCIVPRLQTWGIFFRPRIELDLLLLVAVPLGGGKCGNIVQEIFGGRVKLVRRGSKLGDITCEMREALEYPHIDLGDNGSAPSKLTVEQRSRVVAVAKNFRETVREVGVRRFWVFFGMRCNGSQVRRITVTENEKQRRIVKAREREALINMQQLS